jgi:polyferredoxin
VIKTMKVCNADKFECELFDILLNINLLKLFQEEVCINLLEVFQERVKEKDTDEKAEIVMEKVLYLIMHIAFSNFMLVSGGTWVKVLEGMIHFMK